MKRKISIAAIALAAIIGGIAATASPASADPISTVLHILKEPSF